MKTFLSIVGVLLLVALEVYLIGWLGFGVSLKNLLAHFNSHSVVLTDGQLAWQIVKGIASALAFFPVIVSTFWFLFIGIIIKQLR
jgi:hypothetical protein